MLVRRELHLAVFSSQRRRRFSHRRKRLIIGDERAAFCSRAWRSDATCKAARSRAAAPPEPRSRLERRHPSKSPGALPVRPGTSTIWACQQNRMGYEQLLSTLARAVVRAIFPQKQPSLESGRLRMDTRGRRLGVEHSACGRAAARCTSPVPGRRRKTADSHVLIEVSCFVNQYPERENHPRPIRAAH